MNSVLSVLNQVCENVEMDIARPPLDRQVAPAPWLVYRNQVDVPGSIRQFLTHEPEATIDAVAQVLAARGVQVSPTVIAMWLRRLRADAPQPSAS